MTIVRAVSPNATQIVVPSGLIARWWAPRPTQTRSATCAVFRLTADTDPAAASLTSAQLPPGAIAAIWGERKLCRMASGRRVRARQERDRSRLRADDHRRAGASRGDRRRTGSQAHAADHATTGNGHGQHLVLALSGDERHLAPAPSGLGLRVAASSGWVVGGAAAVVRRDRPGGRTRPQAGARRHSHAAPHRQYHADDPHVIGTRLRGVCVPQLGKRRA